MGELQADPMSHLAELLLSLNLERKKSICAAFSQMNLSFTTWSARICRAKVLTLEKGYKRQAIQSSQRHLKRELNRCFSRSPLAGHGVYGSPRSPYYAIVLFSAQLSFFSETFPPVTLPFMQVSLVSFMGRHAFLNRYQSQVSRPTEAFPI